MLLKMAWRNIWRNKVRSGLIAGSIALGIMAGTFLSGLYHGMMESRMNDVIRNETSHIQIHHPNFKSDLETKFSIPNYHRLQDSISKLIPGSTLSCRIISSAMLTTATGSSGVQVLGINPEVEERVTKLGSKIIDGARLHAEKSNQIILGKKLADKIGAHVGSKVVLLLTDQENNIVSAAFRISALYQTQNSAIDKTIIYILFKDLNSMLGTSDACHEMAIVLPKNMEVTNAQSQIQQKFPELLIETWKELSPEVNIMIETTDSYSAIFIVIVMVTLLFGIINTMLMSVLERTKEIGMLLALGMSRLRLFIMVVLETVLLTFSGVPLGLFLIWVIISQLQEKGIDVSGFAGSTMAGYGFSSIIRPQFPYSGLPQLFSIVTGTALMASFIPAVRTSRLQPAEALRS